MSIFDFCGGHSWSDSSRVPRSRSAPRTEDTKPWAAGAIARGCPFSAAAAARRYTSRQVAARDVTNRMSSNWVVQALVCVKTRDRFGGANGGVDICWGGAREETSGGEGRCSTRAEKKDREDGHWGDGINDAVRWGTLPFYR